MPCRRWCFLVIPENQLSHVCLLGDSGGDVGKGCFNAEIPSSLSQLLCNLSTVELIYLNRSILAERLLMFQ